MSNLIVIDVQPMYLKYIDFNMSDFVDYLSKFDNILYMYVGSEDSGIGTDTKEDIMVWLVEDYGFPEDDLDKITFLDKGYGFLRGKMDDADFDDDGIIKMVKYLIDNDLNDTRDIEDFLVREDLGLEGDVDDEYDPIYLPYTFSISDFKRLSNPILIGGGADECLREIELYLKAYDFKYTKNYTYIY